MSAPQEPTYILDRAVPTIEVLGNAAVLSSGCPLAPRDLKIRSASPSGLSVGTVGGWVLDIKAEEPKQRADDMVPPPLADGTDQLAKYGV